MALVATALSLALGAGAAGAASTPWVEHEGGAVRLVTAGPPDGEGRLRGLVEVFLEPGWKTYWRDPGPSGVPPALDPSASLNVGGAELAFPPPERHGEGAGSWAGYGGSVSLPVTFRLTEPRAPTLIEAELFMGVCEKICVPVQARLSLDPAALDEEEDRLAVAAAFDSLPAEASPRFRALSRGRSAGMLRLALDLPSGAVPQDLFIAGSEHGYALGAPVFREEAGRWTAEVPVAGEPRPGPSAVLPYTLVTDKGAVSGSLPAF